MSWGVGINFQLTVNHFQRSIDTSILFIYFNHLRSPVQHYSPSPLHPAELGPTNSRHHPRSPRYPQHVQYKLDSTQRSPILSPRSCNHPRHQRKLAIKNIATVIKSTCHPKPTVPRRDTTPASTGSGQRKRRQSLSFIMQRYSGEFVHESSLCRRQETNVHSIHESTMYYFDLQSTCSIREKEIPAIVKSPSLVL